MRYQRGFTLFEILIALVIFSILGVMSAIGLHNALNTNQHVDKSNQLLQKVEVAQALLRRDFRQLIDRSILDNDGSRLNAFILTPTSASLTCGGNALYRVDYTFKNGALYRSVWPSLDRALNEKPTTLKLLDHITQFSIKVYDKHNQLQNIWPLETMHELSQTSGSPARVPRAVQINYYVTGFGNLANTIIIPSNGALNNDSAS